jgi:hypothetical protein
LDKFTEITQPLAAIPNMSPLGMVLGMTVRGDKLLADGMVEVGTDPNKVTKYEECLSAAEELDPRLCIFREFMANNNRHGLC